jgi:hypothetical protein
MYFTTVDCSGLEGRLIKFHIEALNLLSQKNLKPRYAFIQSDVKYNILFKSTMKFIFILLYKILLIQ